MYKVSAIAALEAKNKGQANQSGKSLKLKRNFNNIYAIKCSDRALIVFPKN
jgi:hypothetical protein